MPNPFTRRLDPGGMAVQMHIRLLKYVRRGLFAIGLPLIADTRFGPRSALDSGVRAHMPLSSRLIRTELVATAALLLLAAAMAAYMTYDSYLHPYQIFSGLGAAKAGFLATLAFGSGPALLLGAPAHALLAHHGAARWPVILFLGICLGALCFVVSVEIGYLGMLCGGLVALLTHWGVQWVSPNNSCMPNPVRGSAWFRC